MFLKDRNELSEIIAENPGHRLAAKIALDASTQLDERGFDFSDTGTGTIQDNDTATFLISNDTKKEGAGPLSFVVVTVIVDA